MKTYTTKIAKNGATLYYSTESGKRIAKAVALENERNYLLANAEEITAEVDDEEIVDEIDDEEEVSEELDTEDSVDEIDEDAEDDDENEVNENDVTEELNEDRRALETINPEEIVAIATVKMNIAEDEMKLAEAEVNKAYNAIGRLNEKSSAEKRKAAYARADAADVAYDAACQAYQASRKNLEAAYEVANAIRYANIKAEETTEATEQVTEVKADETPAAGISPDEKLAELVNAAKTAWEAQRDKSFNSTQAETFRAATKAITKFLDTTRGAFKAALPENIIVADNWREGEFSGSSDLPSFVIRDLKTGKTLGTYKTLAEVETEVQEVSKNVDADIRYEFNGGAGMDTSPNFATATEAAQWIIDFAANHPEYTFTGGRVHDNGNCKRYPFTDADITALNANKAAQEVSTEKVDIKEIITEGLKQVDFSNVTKFEVGKTYFGATWEGEFNPNVAVIVKKLTVTKITPKTICTVDENGRARRSKFTEAYAGTTEGFTIGTPNGYVDIYAFNEYTPAVAAVPTDNYTAWSEAIMAIREGKTAEVNMVEEKTEVSEYKPQTSWENPHAYETVGDLDTERYLAARNHFTTVEELLPELDELKTEIDTVNDKFLRVSFAIDTCKHFFLNKACDPFFLFRHEYNKEADTIIKASVRLYDKCIAIDFDKTFEHLSTFQYIDHGIRNETYHKAWEIFEAIRDNLGDKVLASELSKLADEFGIDRALLLQSEDCRFNPALFTEKSELPELTGRMKWAAELLDNYTYEFECDKETGKKGLARHYKRFNRYGEQVGKLVEVFTDKTSFILDHVNIVVKSIRAYYYINGEKLSYLDGEFNFIWSDKYNAGMSMVGGRHLQVEVPDGRRKKFPNFAVDDDEFFQIMSERGACTIGEPEPPETPATVAPVETKLPPAEPFTAKRDRLIAERDAANAKLKEAERVFKAAKLADFNAVEKFFDFMVDNMHKLNERINLPDAEIEVKTTDGCLAYIALETVRVAFKDTKFILCGDCSVIYGMTLGIYDTPEQVMTAVEQFKAAIERGDKRFDFANPDQNFDKHAVRDSLERAMKFALERHEGFVKLGQMTAAENEMKLYALCAEAMKELGKGARG